MNYADVIKERILPHLGHNIVMESYDNNADICVECEDCWEVLFSTKCLKNYLESYGINCEE